MGRIGYIRVSTEHQETARQEALMKQYQVERVFAEKISGKNADHPELKAMLEYVREGDTLYIESISRLGRSTRDMLNIIDVLQQKKATLVSSKENIDTNTPQGRFVLSIFAALSELEREQTLQRQREGIAIAKSQGKYKGRQPIPIDWVKFGQLYEQWKSGNITDVDFQKQMGLQANTFYRRLKNTKESIHKQERAGICRLNSFNRMSLLFEICQKPKKLI